MKPLKKHINEIKHIKKKYGFLDEFDLLEKLMYLPTDIGLAPSLPRPAKIRKEITALLKLIKKLNERLRSTSTQTKIEINQTPDFLKSIGFKDIRHQNTGWQLSVLENDLRIFQEACLHAEYHVPEDKGGAQKNSIPKYVIFRLAVIYELGTEKEPTTSWSDYKDVYNSTFYKFLVDVMPILHDLKIKIIKNESFGRYNVDVLKEFRTIMDEYRTNKSNLNQDR